MNSRQLFDELSTLKAYKKDRVRLGSRAIENDLMPDLINFCHPDQVVSHQACWSLEQSFLIYEQDCYPFLDEIADLYTTPINSSGMRSLTKIASICVKKYYSPRTNNLQSLLTITHREQMLEGCFRSLIEHVGKTANMAFATRALHELGKEFDWIYPELQVIIAQHLDRDPNSGYRACGKDTLRKIAEFKAS
jgi:hypothetical protein